MDGARDEGDSSNESPWTDVDRREIIDGMGSQTGRTPFRHARPFDAFYSQRRSWSRTVLVMIMGPSLDLDDSTQFGNDGVRPP